MTADRSCEVAIVGGGLTGALFALLLADHGFDSALIEPRAAQNTKTSPKKPQSPQFYALAPATVALLERLGLWAKISPQATAVKRMVISKGTAQSGPAANPLTFHGAEFAQGALAFIVADALLRDAIQDAIAHKEACPGRIQLLAGAIEPIYTDSPITPSMAQGCKLAIEGGENAQSGAQSGTEPMRIALHAKLCVLAGGGANVAKLAHQFGFCYNVKDYKQCAFIAHIGHEKPHHNSAHQIFTPAGPLAILPVKTHESAIVWTLPTQQARRLKQLGADAFMAALSPLFGDFRGALRLHAPPARFALQLRHTAALTQTRTALIGDAAHNVHPLAGQGLNLGLRGAAALAAVLGAARARGEDIGAADVLARYQRQHQIDIAKIIALTDGLNGLFTLPFPLNFPAHAADAAMALMRGLPRLTQHLAREMAHIE